MVGNGLVKVIVGLVYAYSASAALAVMPSKAEFATARSWSNGHLHSASGVPFSFVYAGRASNELLPAWKFDRSSRDLDRFRTQSTSTWTDPQTGLRVQCVSVAYSDFPTVEWTVYFKNTGGSDTPILSSILALDTTLTSRAPGDFVLHHFTGTPCTPADYQPFETRLESGVSKRISAEGGRPTNSDLPYFNFEWPGGGTVLAVAWPGQWSAVFTRTDERALAVRAGQELTHFRLHAGEEVRTPMIVVQHYEGRDWIEAQNIWRRWMLAHNVPRPGGKLPPVQMAACSSHQFGEMIHANTENQKQFIDGYLREKLPLDYWWMDAGWYVNKTGWTNVGTWEVDQNRFPGGLKPITDHAHARGVKIIVWFEPERVTAGTWLFTQHPEWLLTNAKDPSGQKLLNLGNSDARSWLTDHVDKTLVQEGIDLYRQDHNIAALDFWRGADEGDRQGITEIRYVEGYLAYWDELRRRHPNMLIDSCAGGGRRNDLETLRRAVPLLRSDLIMEPTAQQCHTYGIAFWYPFYGTGTSSTDTYQFRSQMCPHFTACYDMRRTDLDFQRARQIVNQWKFDLGPNLLGDYYPLTPYSLDRNVWMAFQWNRPEAGRGAVQVFRREESGQETQTLKLRGLDPDGTYVFRDLDRGELGRYVGRCVMETGLPVTLSTRPVASVILYSRSD